MNRQQQNMMRQRMGLYGALGVAPCTFAVAAPTDIDSGPISTLRGNRGLDPKAKPNLNATFLFAAISGTSTISTPYPIACPIACTVATATYPDICSAEELGPGQGCRSTDGAVPRALH